MAAAGACASDFVSESSPTLSFVKDSKCCSNLINIPQLTSKNLQAYFARLKNSGFSQSSIQIKKATNSAFSCG